MKLNLQSFIKKRLERKVFTGLPLTIFVIIFLILLATFVGITDSVVNSATIVQIDNSFANYLYVVRTPFLSQVCYIITNFASPVYIAIPIGISLVYLYFKKEVAYLYALLLTCIGTEGSVFLLKIFINRARPGAS